MGPDVSESIHPRACADLTDVTLADEDSNSTSADYVNRAILGNVVMQVVPPGGQNWKWQHLLAKLVTNSRSPSCRPNIQLVHVELSGGQTWN